ncbi:transposase [Bradyrhizobium sp. 160]|nr:transposase [Bradyrhizobium sp. 160]
MRLWPSCTCRAPRPGRKQVIEDPVGQAFSASAISAINKRLDASESLLRTQAESRFPYLILHARYERIREDGIIASHAVLIAIGIDWEAGPSARGRPRQPESRSSWKEFLEGLNARGLHDVEFAVSERLYA